MGNDQYSEKRGFFSFHYGGNNEMMGADFTLCLRQMINAVRKGDFFHFIVRDKNNKKRAKATSFLLVLFSVLNLEGGCGRQHYLTDRRRWIMFDDPEDQKESLSKRILRLLMGPKVR